MDGMEADCFSFLPNALIVIIISFLPFQEAVKTSILSKRWRNIWCTTTNVDLDQNFFIKDKNSDEQRRAFLSFIRQWMEHKPQVEKFRLAFSDPPPEVQDCIKFVVGRREIHSLCLDFSEPTWDEENMDMIVPQYSLHLPFLESHTVLESLGLFACSFPVREFNRFSRLKRVFLQWIELPGSVIHHFLSICPSLEILSLKRCWNMGEELDIDGQRLRNLVLDKCLGPKYITVNTPFLKFFKYCGVSAYLEMEYNKRMEEAVLDFGLQPDSCDEEAHAEMLYKLLTEFWSVGVLTVCSYVLQILPKAENPLKLEPKLGNVKRLNLKTQLHIQEYYGISFLLNSCPRLEILSIDLGPRRVFEGYRPPFKIKEHWFFSHFSYPTCVERTLKTIKVTGFKGNPCEMIVLRYLMKHGKVLQHLLITLSKERGADGIEMESTYRENARKLLQFEISSSNLQLFIYN